MSELADLVLFAHFVRRPERDLDLERAALLIAETEYPGLDVVAYVSRLDSLGEVARQRLRSLGLRAGRSGVAPAHRLAPLLDLLYREMGFRGNSGDYYDPRNSFLNEVMDRRTGIPISLAIVLLAVCRRAGVEAHGVSFPGHFLVRTAGRGGEPIFVDPFAGRQLALAEVRALAEQAGGSLGIVDERLLAPASRFQILARLLNNLRAIYEVRGDRERLERILRRLAVVSPTDELASRLDVLVHSATLAPRVSVN